MIYIQILTTLLHIIIALTICPESTDIKMKRSIFTEFLEDKNNNNNFDVENNEKFCDEKNKKSENRYSEIMNKKNDKLQTRIDDTKINKRPDDEKKDFINTEEIVTTSHQPTNTFYKRIQLPQIDNQQVGVVKNVVLPGGLETTVKILSNKPFIFEVENFLDEDDCDLLIDFAKAKKLKPIQNNVPDVHLKTAESTFHEWDYNQDGRLTTDEIILLPGLSGLNYTLEDADDMFFLLKMDMNNDKEISLDEFRNTDFSQLKAYFTRVRNDKSRQRNLTSQGAWVWHDQDELLKYSDDGYFEDYHERISFLTGLPKVVVEESEPLQVRHFENGQFQYGRHDSEPVTKDLPCCLYGDMHKVCRQCRYLSMSIFLNDDVTGGEIVFPLANTKYQNILENSGEWRGYFIYAKTTGNKFYFKINMNFTLNGANRVFKAHGADESGDFQFNNGIIIDDTVKFEKVYNSDAGGEGIKYQGKLVDGNKISGYWWIPNQKRLRGSFFMWNKDYDIFSSKAIDSTNTIHGCTNNSLVIQPEKGKAIFWYNHQIDAKNQMLGELNQESLYAQCEVTKGHKWVASTWINIIGDGDLELRAWRRGNNFLTDLTHHQTIYKTLGTNESKLSHESYESEYLTEITGKNQTEGDNLEGYYKHKPASSALQAIQLLLNDMNNQQMKLLASNVHKKLGLTCVPMGAIGGGGH